MKMRFMKPVAAAAVALALGACADMTHQEKSALAGAAIGGVAGNVVTGGSTVGTLGGAAVGGVIGHEVSRP